MTDERVSELESFTADREALQAKMAGVRNDFVAQVAAELPDRWNTLAGSWIENFSDEARGLGSEGLRPLRSAIHALSPADVAEEQFKGPWPHERQRAGQPGFVASEHLGKVRITGIQEALEVAEDAALPAIRAVFHSGFKSRNTPVPLSPELRRTLDEYQQMAREYLDLDRKIRALSASISKEEARSIWDSLDE